MTSLSTKSPQYQPASTRVGRTTSSNPSRNPTQKFARPAPLTRRTTPSSGTARVSRSGPLSPSLKRKEKSDEEEKLDMATGFLPFCAMCEKQIMTPHNSILYCSQSCQRQDSRKPLSASSISLSPSPTPPSSPISPRSILPPLEPTKLPPSTSPTMATATATTTTTTTTIRIPDHTHDLTSDLDPSEWKPTISGSQPRHSGIIHSNIDSTLPIESFNFPSYSIPSTRSRHERNSSTTSNFLKTVPSLTNSASSSPSPSPSPSPTLTNATIATAAMSRGNSYDSMSKHYRPLPPLHKPSLSASGSAKRGVELVMPQAALRVVA